MEDRETLYDEINILHSKVYGCKKKFYEAINLLRKEGSHYRNYCFITRELNCNNT